MLGVLQGMPEWSACSCGKALPGQNCCPQLCPCPDSAPPGTAPSSPLASSPREESLSWLLLPAARGSSPPSNQHWDGCEIATGIIIPSGCVTTLRCLPCNPHPRRGKLPPFNLFFPSSLEPWEVSICLHHLGGFNHQPCAGFSI